MDDIFTRSRLLIGDEAVTKLRNSSVIVFGAGGVGSYAIEALARMGIGSITVVDGDVFAPSNLNRQLYATTESIGKSKALEALKRINLINAQCKKKAFDFYYTSETACRFELDKYDYIIDAIDSVDDKVLLIKNAKRAGTPIISSMGAGNKLDGTKFKVADIYQTSVCPLARVMRKRLKKENIESLKTVYSTERPIIPENCNVTASVSFVPSVAGMIIAGEVVKDII